MTANVTNNTTIIAIPARTTRQSQSRRPVLPNAENRLLMAAMHPVGATPIFFQDGAEDGIRTRDPLLGDYSSSCMLLANLVHQAPACWLLSITRSQISPIRRSSVSPFSLNDTIEELGCKVLAPQSGVGLPAPAYEALWIALLRPLASGGRTRRTATQTAVDAFGDERDNRRGQQADQEAAPPRTFPNDTDVVHRLPAPRYHQKTVRVNRVSLFNNKVLTECG